MVKIFKTYIIIAIISVIIFTIQPVSAEQASNIIVKFAHVSDTHLSSTKLDNSRRLLKYSKLLLTDCIKQINMIDNLDFTIFTGDMVNKGSQNYLIDFVNLANKLEKPYYVALGNHELYSKSTYSKQNEVNLLKTHTMSMQNGLPYYTIDSSKVYKVIVLDATGETYNTSNGHFDNKQLEWLKDTLDSSKNSIVIIALHHAIVEPVKSSTHRIVEPDRTKLYNLINQYKNVVLVLNGHYHTTKIQKDQGIIYESAPALIEYPNAFRIITIKDNGEIDFKWKETSYKNLQEKSKSRSKWASTSYGKPSDRSATLKFEMK